VEGKMKKTLSVLLVVIALAAIGYGNTWFTAAFTCSATIAEAGDAIQFTDKSTGNIVSWRWRFSDNSGGSTEQNPIHVFNTPGYYRVFLKVTNKYGGVRMVMKMITIVPAMKADFTWAPNLPVETLPVQFTDLSEGTYIAKWFWSFGDGEYSTDQNPVHTYARAGTYNVTLTIWGESGEKSQVTMTI
jgi:PKD repeat protein